MKTLNALLALLLPLWLHAQAPNLNFEQPTADAKPVGWNRFGNAYRFGLDSATKHGGRYALRIDYVDNSGFCAADWQVPVTFSGKSITLTAFVKTQDTGLEPNTYAGLWLRVDDQSGNAIAFDNMQSRGIKSTTDWHSYQITLPLNEEAQTIHLGGLLIGKGTAWFDDFSLLVDGKPVDKASPRLVQLAQAQTDSAFSNGSGIELSRLTTQQIDNLTVLGKVWGFVKYYHPAVAEGKHNMDAELFRIMPKVINTASRTERGQRLLDWLTRFGPVSPGHSADTSQAVHQPDLAWLADSNQLSAPLSHQLQAIRQAKRPTKSFYVRMAAGVGNPEFMHENPYRRMKAPDAGYRLLSLYRFWNIIQYFFPYKHLIGEDWKQVLTEFVPRITGAQDSLSYRLTALALISRIHDTHANLWGDAIIRTQYKGTYYSPVQVKFIQNQLVVTNYYHDSLGRASGLRPGDVIESIDKVPVQTLVHQRKPYYPASNEPTRLRDMSRDLLVGRTNQTQVAVERAGQRRVLTLQRYKDSDVHLNYQLDYSSYPKDSCYQLLAPDIGYLFLGNIKADKLPQIMHLFRDTKGLVIDLRCYPSEFVVFSLGRYLTGPVPFVKFTGGSVQTPGQFNWSPLLEVGERNVKDAYRGKVIILVNESTQSQAEYTTMAFRQAPGALVIGSTTAAADGNVSGFELPGGLRTMISGIGVNYPDGRETQRVGVGVDAEVMPTRQGIEAGRDELLEKAVSLIRAAK